MTRVAIVYDWMDKWGGVERLLLVLHQMYPDAEFYTSFYDKERARWARGITVRTSFMQRLPKFIKSSRILSLPFFPYAFESFNFRDYDLVISVTSSYAKSVVTHPHTKHICILLTPTRFLWSHTDGYLPSPLVKILAAPIIRKLREYNFVAARRPDKLLAISRLVSERCKKFYRLNSEVLYPPFDTSCWEGVKKNLEKMPDLPEKYFLAVARLERYKRIELAIRACNELKLPLIVVGSGSQKEHLKEIAGPTVIFRENVTDEALGTLYSNAQALLMPQEEDFGYTALEAQFFGCPVITFAHSGATETVIEGKTAIFFQDHTVASLKDAIEQYVPIAYNMRRKTAAIGSKQVAAFSVLRFKHKIARFITE